MVQPHGDSEFLAQNHELTVQTRLLELGDKYEDTMFTGYST
jgi:hypothetical protein